MLKIKYRYIILGVIFISIMLLLFHSLSFTFNAKKNIQQFDNKDSDLRILMYTPIPPDYVIETIDFWADSLSLDGFIIGDICEWYSKKDDIDKRSNEIRKFNWICKENGIKYNFLKIALGYEKFPMWTDSVKINFQLEKFQDIIRWSSKVGFYGIAFDTEPYTVPLWDSNSKRFKNISKKKLRESISKFGYELSKIIIKNFDNYSIIILPEGEYFYKNRSNMKYELWSEFFKGFQKGGLEKIIIGCEMSYKITEPSKIEKFNKDLHDSFESLIFSNYKSNIKFAFGAWPLGYYKSIRIPFTKKRYFLNRNLEKMKSSWEDKSPNYSSEEFQIQLSEFKKYSPQWIWIYTHGASWWQLDTLKYTKIWNPKNQELPVYKNIDEYIKVLANIKN